MEEQPANGGDGNDGDGSDLSLAQAILNGQPLDALRSIVEARPHLVRVRHAEFYGITPLHLAAHACLPLESVHFLYRGWPGALRETFRLSELPIHCLASSPNLVAGSSEGGGSNGDTNDNGNDNENSDDDDDSSSSSQQQLPALETARFFIEQWPGSLRHGDGNHKLPLHRAVQNPAAPIELVRLLVQHHPGSVRERCGPSAKYSFPLHDAVTASSKRRTRDRLSVVKCMYEAWPAAAHERDAKGRASNARGGGRSEHSAVRAAIPR
jgi:hypothetical protein